MGPSGSGKSTLLNLIAGLDRPTSGTAQGRRQRLSTDERRRPRALPLAAHRLHLPGLQPDAGAHRARERRAAAPAHEALVERATKRAQTALRVVGLEDRMDHYPRQLSGGQEQRVAIARAIVNDPTIIVADEPTGDLDRKSADDILTLLTKLNEEFKKTILMVTHDPAAAERATVIAPPRTRASSNERPLRHRGAEPRSQLVAHDPDRARRGRGADRVRHAAHRAQLVGGRRRVRREGPPRHASQGVVRDAAAQEVHRRHPRRARREAGDVGELVRRQGSRASPTSSSPPSPSTRRASSP